MSGVSRCAACGAFVKAEDRFCWSCGLELHGTASASVRPARERRAEAADGEGELALRHAYLARRRGQLEEAERLLREVLQREQENVSALSLLAEVLQLRGEVVEAAAIAQRATELGSQEGAPPGAVAQAREARARIEESAVREARAGSPVREGGSLSDLVTPGLHWYRSKGAYLALAVVGIAAFFLALVATLRGQFTGYLWFAVSFMAAGWCYYDAETRREAGLLWGPVVLCLGPFGLAIYLLTRC